MPPSIIKRWLLLLVYFAFFFICLNRTASGVGYQNRGCIFPRPTFQTPFTLPDIPGPPRASKCCKAKWDMRPNPSLLLSPTGKLPEGELLTGDCRTPPRSLALPRAPSGRPSLSLTRIHRADPPAPPVFVSTSCRRFNVQQLLELLTFLVAFTTQIHARRLSAITLAFSVF